jgi:hypothetical protein
VPDEVIAGRYRLQRRLGGGGMSEVWLATDLDLDREVAVKLLAASADPERFRREARAAAALAHPSICTIYSYGEAGSRPFIVLEYLSGGSLEQRLAPGHPLPDHDSERIAGEIAAGLAHAHAQGLVHRDLKPANVLFDGLGHAKIADFGIAQIGHESELTDAGTVLGTAAYISPEQAAGEPATPASDVYAFGVILFRMLTGRLPFEAEDALTLAAMHREQLPPSAASLRPDVPARLESVAAAALAKSPSDRPGSGADLIAELTSPAGTTATGVVRPRRDQGRTVVVVVAAAILAAAGVALAIAVTFGGESRARTTRTTSQPARTTALPAAPAPVTDQTGEATPPATTARTVTATSVPEPTTVRSTTVPATVRSTPMPTTVAPPVPATTSTAAPPTPTTIETLPPTTFETTQTDTVSTATATIPATVPVSTAPAPPTTTEATTVSLPTPPG